MSNAIINGMARALHVNAWANAVEEILECVNGGDCTWEQAMEHAIAMWHASGKDPDWLHELRDTEPAGSVARNIHTTLRAGAGADWMDVAPPTPDIAIRAATALFRRVVLDSSLDQLVAILNSDDLDEYGLGHYLAMEALGTGVSWEDSNDPHGLTVPSVEFSYYAGDDGKLYVCSHSLDESINNAAV